MVYLALESNLLMLLTISLKVSSNCAFNAVLRITAKTKMAKYIQNVKSDNVLLGNSLGGHIALV